MNPQDKLGYFHLYKQFRGWKQATIQTKWTAEEMRLSPLQ